MTAPNPTTPPAGDPPATPPTTPPPAPAPPAGQPAPAAGDPPKDDKPLGPNGEKALAAEREARKALEKQIQALAPLQKLAEALGTGTPAADGKSELDLLNERFAQHEQDLASEREARWRAEVGHDKGLTTEQAARLIGKTKDELAADADALLALFPAAPTGPRAPAPDPSQGARGGGAPDIDTQIREAQAKGDVKTVLRLQNDKLIQLGTKTN